MQETGPGLTSPVAITIYQVTFLIQFVISNSDWISRLPDFSSMHVWAWAHDL
jgi:hypothetical protein